MSPVKILLIISVGALVNFAMRSLPFIIFRGERKMPEFLERLGAVLPSAVMSVLVVYCLKQFPADPTGLGIRQLAGALVVAVSYKWKHSSFLSIVLGTAVYMLLLK